MIPDYQTLMRPVLECAARGEVKIGDVVEKLADEFGLSPEERDEPLPSGRQARFANRVHWAKTYLKQAGLVRPTKRAHFEITDRGRSALSQDGAEINNDYLSQFEGLRKFRARNREVVDADTDPAQEPKEDDATPDEVLRAAHKKINAALAEELLDRVRAASPSFFEQLIVDLLLAMGYGDTSEDAGRALGKSGNGVIDQDPLGVDQIYVQAKRYADGNNVGADAIRC